MTLQFSTERFVPEAEPTDPRFETFLDAALGALPRERASDDFTAQVLQQVETRGSGSQWRSLAAALALLAIGMGTYSWNEKREQDAVVERIAMLRAEYEVLRDELVSLEQAKQGKNLVYLGGKNDVEFVLDLGRLASAKQSPTAAGPGAVTAADKIPPAQAL